MQKELSSATRAVRKWIKGSKALDVVLFGSAVRGKSIPNDIDLCILIRDDDEKRSLDLVDSLGRATDGLGFKFHINVLTSGSFLAGNPLAKTLLNEGYSIKKGRMLSAVLGFQNKSLFIYTLKHFSPSGRVKFHYLLKGRYGSEGILKEAEGEFLGTGSILVPTSKEDLLKEVFDKWGVKYRIERMLIG
ncbi:MAG: nucleotidyltransferase domain-containing protein [Nanoarchaeota archaeon]|nr:nucleotidyltransferase domain-containing protein [Nanoarchaeota archaeon]